MHTQWAPTITMTWPYPCIPPFLQAGPRTSGQPPGVACLHRWRQAARTVCIQGPSSGRCRYSAHSPTHNSNILCDMAHGSI